MDVEKRLKISPVRTWPWIVSCAFTDGGQVVLVGKLLWPNSNNDHCRYAHRTIGTERQPADGPCLSLTTRAALQSDRGTRVFGTTPGRSVRQTRLKFGRFGTKTRKTGDSRTVSYGRIISSHDITGVVRRQCASRIYFEKK